MRPAAARSASVVPAILALAFTCGATASYAQNSQGSGSSSSATQVGSFSFVLRGCQNDENAGVTCHFRATNLSSDRLLQVAGGNASYIIDANGGQHVAQSIRLGTGEGATMTTTNVPIEGTIAFGVFDPGVRKIAELHLLVTGGQINWHNVSLQAAAKSEDADNDGNQEQPAHHPEDSGSSGDRSVKVASSEAPAHGHA
jgi:hypothetical protein